MNDMICDFCGMPDPKWITPADNVELGTIIAMGIRVPDHSETHFSVGGWAACDICVVFIRYEDRRGLLERCVEISMKRYGFDRKTTEAFIGQVQSAFWKAKSGDPIYDAD